MAVLAATTALMPGAAVAAGHPGRPGPVSAPAGLRIGHGADAAVITRNSYGVPSIYAGSMTGVWFGAGWAQAQDRMVQLELTRRAVEGTLSAIFGPGELNQDQTVRTFFYTPAELRAQYRALPRSTRRALVAFADGINAYEASAYATAPSALAKVPYEFFALGQALGLSGPYRPAPWQPTDTMAVGDYLAREFGGGGGNELQYLGFLQYLEAELTAAATPMRPPTPRRSSTTPAGSTTRPRRPRCPARLRSPPAPPGSGASASGPRVRCQRVGRARPSPAVRRRHPAGPAQRIATGRTLASLAQVSRSAVAKAAAALAADRKTILKTGISLRVLAHGGSNAVVAVRPGDRADHHALLWGAPQEGFGTPSVDGEEYLHAPGYDAGGMYITGEPFILIGRNAAIAWTTTSEETVDQRIYVEQVNFATSPPTYLFDGNWIPMQAIKEQIDVAGQAAPQPFTVYRTVRRPGVPGRHLSGMAFSIRFASWNRETGSLAGFAQLGGDTNLRQFRHSMSLITTLHNFLYADRRATSPTSATGSCRSSRVRQGRPAAARPRQRHPAVAWLRALPRHAA